MDHPPAVSYRCRQRVIVQGITGRGIVPEHHHHVQDPDPDRDQAHPEQPSKTPLGLSSEDPTHEPA
jgi:hypothetical protein